MKYGREENDNKEQGPKTQKQMHKNCESKKKKKRIGNYDMQEKRGKKKKKAITSVAVSLIHEMKMALDVQSRNFLTPLSFSSSVFHPP